MSIQHKDAAPKGGVDLVLWKMQRRWCIKNSGHGKNVVFTMVQEKGGPFRGRLLLE